MNINLGNLSLDDMQARLNVTFPQGLIDLMSDSQQEKASNIQIGKWHCFDIPFMILCGDMETAKKIHRWLMPLQSEFKESLQIATDGS